MLTFTEALEQWEAAQKKLNDASLEHELSFSKAVMTASGSNAEQRKASVMQDEGVVQSKIDLQVAQLEADRAKTILTMAGKMHVINAMQEAGITALPH